LTVRIGRITGIGRISVREQDTQKNLRHWTIRRVSPHEKRELGKTVGMIAIELFRIPKLPD